MKQPKTRKKPAAERRETLLSTRVTEAEEGAVAAWAATHGVGRSEAVRQLLAAGLGRRPSRGRDAAPRMDAEAVRALAEVTNPGIAAVNRLGNVVDQVARRLHQGGTVSERRIVELLDAFQDVHDEQRNIGSLLSVAIETVASNPELLED